MTLSTLFPRVSGHYSPNPDIKPTRRRITLLYPPIHIKSK